MKTMTEHIKQLKFRMKPNHQENNTEKQFKSKCKKITKFKVIAFNRGAVTK